MRPRFWELPLRKLAPDEWEALCDGCGKCCLNKIEYEDTGEVAFTRVACRLLDGESCQCSSYANRHDFVPDCVVLTPRKLKEIAWWLPATCAYRLRAEGKPALRLALPDLGGSRIGPPRRCLGAGLDRQRAFRDRG